MPTTCSIYGCKNIAKKGGNISFHKFPNNPKFCKKWIVAMRRKDFKVRAAARLCSEHFDKNDFIYQFGRKILKPEAVPSKFNFPDGLKKPKPRKRSKRPLKNELDVKKAIPSNTEDVKSQNSQVIQVVKEMGPIISTKSDKLRPIGCMTDEYPSHDSSITETASEIGSEELRCRTCLMSERSHLKTTLDEICFKGKTVKETVLRVVPGLRAPLRHSDLICDSCLQILTDTLRFTARCLEVDELMSNEWKNTKSQDVSVDKILSADENSQEMDDFEKTELVTSEAIPYEAIQYDEDVSASEEEQCFEELTSFCNKRSRCKSIWKAQFANANIRNHGKVVCVETLQEEVVNDFLFSIQSEVQILHHSSASETGNKRILLLGNGLKKKCPACDSEFLTETKFWEHFESDHKDLSRAHLMKALKKIPSINSLQCDICTQIFDSFKSKKSHMKRCTFFKCPYCSDTFSSYRLTRHTTEKHADPFPFKCATCKVKYRDYRKRQSHVCGGVVCEKCGKRINQINRHKCLAEAVARRCYYCRDMISKESFEEHLKQHKTFICNHCEKGFLSNSQLKAHRAKHFEKALCPYCGKLLAKAHLSIHISSHENLQRHIKCDVCDKKYYTQASLKNHIKLSHAGDRVICELCGNTFRSMNMRRHFLLKHDPDRVKFPCTVCPREFLSKIYLEKHMESHGTKLEPRVIRRRKRAKTGHRRILKAGNEPVSCKFCLKSFKDVYQLKYHLPIHVKYHRFKCRHCGLTYANEAGRNRHEKQHKRGPDYNYRCNVCWKVMPNQTTLEVHEATHISKKYICEECGEPFARKYLYNTHILKHAGEDEVLKEKMLMNEAIEDCYLQSDSL